MRVHGRGLHDERHFDFVGGALKPEVHDRYGVLRIDWTTTRGPGFAELVDSGLEGFKLFPRVPDPPDRNPHVLGNRGREFASRGIREVQAMFAPGGEHDLKVQIAVHEDIATVAGGVVAVRHHRPRHLLHSVHLLGWRFFLWSSAADEGERCEHQEVRRANHQDVKP